MDCIHELSSKSMSAMHFYVFTKQSNWVQVLLDACLLYGWKHLEELVNKLKMLQDPKRKTSTVFTEEEQDTTDIPRPSTDFEKTDAKLACLGQLMMTVCADLFKDVLHHYIQPAELETELLKICDNLTSIMNNEQRRFLETSMELWSYMLDEGDAKHLITKDLSLLYILIRFMCNIPPPQTGWGCRPGNDDKSLAACIERIRILGKTILDHSKETKEILESDFQDILKNIRTNISEIQKIVFKKDSYTQAVDEFLSLKMKLSDRYIGDFKKLTRTTDTISPFAVIQYYPDRETENLYRVLTLIDTIPSNLFKDTIRRFVNPTSLEFERRIGIFGLVGIHMAQAFPTSRLESEEINLLFCYNFLRKNCGISQHKRGWGFLPDTNDHSLAACIDRLMLQRKAIAATMKYGTSESNFKDILRTLRDDIIEIEQQVIGGNTYEQRIDNLFSMPINQVFAVKYVVEQGSDKLSCMTHLERIMSKRGGISDYGMPETSSLLKKPDDGETGMPEMSSLSLKSDDGESGIPEKLSLSTSPDDGETEEDCRSLPAFSTEQTELFESVDKTIEQKFSKDSLAGDIFEEQGLTLVGREIKSLSKEVPVLHNPAIYQRTRGFKPGAVLILEVEVSKQNGEVKCIEKNTIFAGNICKSKRDYNPRVLLVKSKPELKEDAKRVVFRKYRDLIFMGNTFVQHETDDDLELSKLSAFYSVSFVCDQIQPMIKFHKVYIGKAIETFFSKTNISFVFFGVILKDGDIEVGSVAHESYFCNNEISVDLFRQNLELEAVRKICTAFGLDFHLRNNALSRHINLTETSLPFDIYGRILFQAVVSNLPHDADRLHAKVTMPVDVNSSDWRQEVAKALFTSIKGNICKIEERFEELCIETHNDLKRVCTQLELYKNRCHQNSIKEYIIGCVNEEREHILEEFPSVLTYIVGKKHGKSKTKVFLKYDDSKAEGYFRNAFDKHVTQFVNVSKTIEDNLENPSPYKSRPLMDNDVRKRLKEVIKRHSTALTTNHSQIFQISTGTMPDGEGGEKPCIVIHCFDKSLVPIGEQELPNQLENYPIYIKEGLIMFGSCVECTSIKRGCSIGVPNRKGSGSIGIFTTRKPDTLTKEIGFITAAHVALPTFKEFYKAGMLFTEHIQETHLQKEYKIVHPAEKDNPSSQETIGVVSEAFCGTYGINDIGIDAAFINTSEYKEFEADIALQIANEDELKFDGNTLVTKTGKRTLTTKGKLHDEVSILSIPKVGVPCTFKNFYSIRNLDPPEPPFFFYGDSGSGVYLIDEDGSCNKALGIAFALQTDIDDNTVETYVCSIRGIVNAFNIDATLPSEPTVF
uniref:Uncharacterized protein LOC111112657 isoform X3 n=1 Tax=Crassostrea virginica TaxID=6565 RepID=A0A8B8BRY7_CRAVI|nr:uncharacterized protein LOC111112657 isoform X3 [Crassostrea virginica]